MKPGLSIVALVTLFLGCGDSQPLGPRGGSAQPQALSDLAQSLRAGPLPATRLRDPQLSSQLAALLAEPADTGLVLAALRELPRCWGQDPDVRALLPLLDDPDERVLAGALRAATLAREQGSSDPDLERKLRQLAADSRPTVRLAAYQSLVLGLGPDRGSGTGQLLAEALADQETPLVATVLQGLSGRTYALDDRQAVETACRDLLAHADPGVRGAAAEVLSQLVSEGPARETLALRLEELLADPHPHVVSQAAAALGRLRHVPALPALLGLLEDSRADSYRLPGVPRLDVPSETLVFRASTWQRVDDAALRAIERISASLPGEPFAYGTVRAERLEADIARQVAQARFWYEDAAEQLEED